MALIAPAVMRVSPSYVEPGLILSYMQPSGAFELVGGGKPIVRLSENDLAVYVNRLDVRTKAAIGQSSYNMLPTAELSLSTNSTPTYNFRCRNSYDYHDTSAAAGWNVALPEAIRLAGRQSIFQSARLALLYGMNPTNGEGLINTNGATTATLGTDTQGHTTLSTWDSGEVAQYFLTLIGDVLVRTNQLGQQQRIVILSTQRVMKTLQFAGVVQLTSWQRVGAGSATAAEMVTTVSKQFGVDVIWACDDTLIGKGSGGTDAIIIAIPEVKKPEIAGFDINEFQRLEPGMNAVTAMYTDMAAPKETMSPLPGGATDVLFEQRFSSGVAWRGEAVTILSAAYS
jgi:hypothetical protein